MACSHPLLKALWKYFLLAMHKYLLSGGKKYSFFSYIYFFFFPTLFYKHKEGVADITLNALSVKKIIICRFSTCTFCRPKQNMNTFAYAGSNDYLCEGGELSR